MGSLGKSLRQTLKKLANNTPVDQLVKRGVKEVSVVGLDHVVSLIEEAVHRSLRNKMMGLDREQVADATREEFLKLLQSKQSLERSRDEAVEMKVRAEEQVDELRRELSATKQMLEEQLVRAEEDERARYEGEDTKIIEQVDELFAALAAEGETNPDLRDHMIATVMDVVRKERRLATEARQSAHDREVDTLQRRISKLKTNLEATEGRLADIASLKDVDPGISSIYREVQGLDSQERMYARKRELMADIFRANLTLQKGATVPES